MSILARQMKHKINDKTYWGKSSLNRCVHLDDVVREGKPVVPDTSLATKPS